MYILQRLLVFLGLLAVIVGLALLGYWLPIGDAVPMLGAILYLLALPYLQNAATYEEEG